MEASKRYTVDEIERLPEDQTFELLRGELLPVCPTGFNHGDTTVRLVCVVDPRRRIATIYTPDGMARILREGDILDGGDVLPGFSIPVAEIFAGLDEAE